MPTVDYQVGASLDDGRELSTGSANTNDATFNVDQANEWVGVRFTGVTIPAGATIDVAYLTLHFGNANLDEPDLTIYGEDTASPAQYSATSNDISGRSRTTASVDWSNANLGAPGAFNTSDISTIVQELVDSHSYASGAPMAFMWTSRANDSIRDAEVTLYDGSTTNAPKLHIEYTEAGGGAYTLTADGAIFTQTGQSANLLAGRKVAADSGAFAHTGQAASLLMGRVIGADSGSYTLTGQDAGLRAARLLGADTGAFTLTGQDADLVYTPVGGYTLTADAGAYTLSGQDASLLIARWLSADSGAYTLTGQDATLVYQPAGGYTLIANAGTYDLTGQDAALLAARILTANSGAYELTGQAATLARGYLMQAASGSYTVTGQDAAFLLGRVLGAGSGSFTLTGQAVTLVYSGAELPVTPSTRIYIVEAENRIYLIAAESRSYTVPTERRVYAVSA